MAKNSGKIAQVIGPVIDVTFPNDGGGKTELPSIMDALEVTKDNGELVVLEIQQHVGEDTVRTVAMEATDGLQRGMEVVATGSPIMMPIGDGLTICRKL